jgi:hypothetical protein
MSESRPSSTSLINSKTTFNIDKIHHPNPKLQKINDPVRQKAK